MNILQSKLLILFLLQISLYTQANVFLDAAQDRIDKVTKKPMEHKSPLEFKQAIIRYIKNTDVRCLQNVQRNSDENISYKKELLYLFKNYGKFSAVTLLSRLRSAHQAMVKHDTNVEGETYKRYEQISSALLLTCCQVFFNDARNQILNALHDIDNLLVYWRYQQNHRVRYFFGKSPLKWIVGKGQEKELAHNITRLERKQRELYTLLGSLTGHIHAFVEVGSTYHECYDWIEELFEIASCITISPTYNADRTRFDTIAATLELKFKKVSKLKHDCMASLAAVQKSNHFVRNWIVYTTLLAIASYGVHYHSKNPLVLRNACEKVISSIGSIGKSVVVDPLTDLWRVFFETNSECSITSIEEKIAEIEKYSNITQARVAELTDPKIKSLQQYSFELLERTLIRMEAAEYPYGADKFLGKKRFSITKPDIEAIMKDVKMGDLGKLSALLEGTSTVHLDQKVDLGISNVLLMLHELLALLKKYPELIDEGILPLVQQIGFLFADFGKVVSGLLKNNFWTVKLAAFTPLAGACFMTHKTYHWVTTHDYSPIRIALADINALLIEAADHLDDHDYGKLMYLICKLKLRAMYLKDSLSNEFLSDVAKLESKQYSAQVKRGIVENMFNKYAFLGRIAI